MRMPRLVSKKLQASDARHFVGDTMFDRCARATCAAGVNMPKKELLENWTLASMIHDRYWARAGGDAAPPTSAAPPARVVDVASGHGLLGWFLLALCAASQRPAVFAVDRRMPDSAAALRDSFGEAFPALPARHRYVVADAADVDARGGDTLVLALHACGGLSDLVIDAAVGGGASLCLVPCCHSLKTAKMAPERLAAARRAVDGGAGLDDALDGQRVAYLEERGMVVDATKLPEDITPKNTVLFAAPGVAAPRSRTTAVPIFGAAPRALPRPPSAWRSLT